MQDPRPGLDAPLAALLAERPQLIQVVSEPLPRIASHKLIRLEVIARVVALEAGRRRCPASLIKYSNAYSCRGYETNPAQYWSLHMRG